LILSSNLTEDAKQKNLRLIKDASDVDIGRFLDENSFPGNYQIFVAPDSAALKRPGSVRAADKARMLLQSNDWYLISAKGKIGWINAGARS